MSDLEKLLHESYASFDHLLAQRDKLRAALQLAKDMFVINDISLPNTMEVIDEALIITDITYPSEALPEPVANLYVFENDAGDVDAMLDWCKGTKAIELPIGTHKLYTSPNAARVPDDHPVFKFLLGEAPLDGCMYGDGTKPATEQGYFWWRKQLRELISATPTQSAQGGE